MARTSVCFQFGRLNLLPHVGDKNSFLQRGFRGGAVDNFRGVNWGFSDVEQFEEQGEPYFSGLLVRYSPVSQEEVMDIRAQRIDTEQLENAVEAKSRFVLHVPSLLLAFHPVPQIGRDTFTSRFVRLFEENHRGFFVSAEIQMVQEERVLLEAMRRFTLISRVSIYLHPSNPRNTERWRIFDERIKSVNATEYREEYVAKIERGDEGLRAVGDPEIEGKIVMAEDGYGKAKVSGVLDGRVQTVATGKEPIKAEVPSEEVAEPPAIVAVIHRTVSRIMERFR